MIKITWNDHEDQVGSIDELDRALDDIHTRLRCAEPELVTVERPNGDSLSIGLGREDISVMNYVGVDQDPPYFTSSGGSDVDEAIAFRFGGEWSEFPLRNGIPIQRARAAMRHFCETGQLSEEVIWEEA